jgi:hypothetical protein
MNKNISSIIQLTTIILVIFIAAILVLVGASINLVQFNSPINKSKHFLDRLANNIFFTENQIELIERKQDLGATILSGYTQTDCQKNEKVYRCNVKVSFILNRYGYLETINLIILDPNEREYFLISVTDIDGRNNQKKYKYPILVKIKVREIDESQINQNPTELFNDNRNLIRSNRHKYDNLESTITIKEDTLRYNGRLKLILDIIFRSRGESKKNKIFLNTKIK